MPPVLRESETWAEFIGALDEYFETLRERLNRLRFYRRADLTPEPFLLAGTVGGYITAGSTRRDARIAADEAGKRYRTPLSFATIWKPIIDRVTGGNARIYRGPRAADDFRLEQSVLGDIDRLGTDTGTATISERLAPALTGTVQIDLRTTIDANTRAHLEAELIPLRDTPYDYLIGETRTETGTEYFHTFWKL